MQAVAVLLVTLHRAIEQAVTVVAVLEFLHLAELPLLELQTQAAAVVADRVRLRSLVAQVVQELS
jgi:hypothetical protein